MKSILGVHHIFPDSCAASVQAAIFNRCGVLVLSVSPSAQPPRLNATMAMWRACYIAETLQSFADRSRLVADGRILQAYSKLQQLGNLRHIDIFSSHLSAAELGVDPQEVAELKQRIDEVR